MDVRRLQPAHRFAALVAVAGSGLLAFLIVRGNAGTVMRARSGFWLLAFFVVVGELFPIIVPRRDEAEEITTSTTFAFALLLGYGAPAAAVVLAVASATADFVYRKPFWKVMFNVGQYVMSIAAAGAVYKWLGGPLLLEGGELDVGLLPPFLAGATAFFFVNNMITGSAVGLAQVVPLARYIRRDIVFQAATAAALLALSPIVVVTAERSLWLVPLLALPVAAVYWGATASLENTRLVGRLRHSLTHMTELNRAKDDFVAVVSHELRTPLTSIQGYIKTLLQLASELDEEQQRAFLEAADRQSDRLRRLIEQLLVVSRIESHVEPLAVAQVSLPILASHVVDELRPRAHGHTFDTRFPADFETVETDEAKVHQILSNLVENALKYSPPDTRVTLEGTPSLHGVVVSVHDEGPGIPEEFQERVFERFYQVDQSTTRRVGGTGLGLYICTKMAELIGARLWLDRSDATGSTFSLFVPAHPPEGEDDDVGPREKRDQSMTARV